MRVFPRGCRSDRGAYHRAVPGTIFSGTPMDPPGSTTMRPVEAIEHDPGSCRCPCQSGRTSPERHEQCTQPATGTTRSTAAGISCGRATAQKPGLPYPAPRKLSLADWLGDPVTPGQHPGINPWATARIENVAPAGPAARQKCRPCREPGERTAIRCEEQGRPGHPHSKAHGLDTGQSDGSRS